MKKDIYTGIICKNFCSYFKGGKEEMRCGGYKFLLDNFTPSEVKQLAELTQNPEELKKQIPPDNEELFNLICERCDFRVDGCDYSENRSGPPCGGFILVERLIQS